MIDLVYLFRLIHFLELSEEAKMDPVEEVPLLWTPRWNHYSWTESESRFASADERWPDVLELEE